MAGRADAAGTGSDAGHLPEQAAFAKLFEAPEFINMETRVQDITVVVQLDGDLGMPFDTGDGGYGE